MRKQITVDGVTSNTINAHQVAPDLKRNGEGGGRETRKHGL